VYTTLTKPEKEIKRTCELRRLDLLLFFPEVDVAGLVEMLFKYFPVTKESKDAWAFDPDKTFPAQSNICKQRQCSEALER